MRLVRFASGLWWLTRKVPGLLSVRNVRALWLQSDRDWQARQRLDLTDEEADAFLAACDGEDA